MLKNYKTSQTALEAEWVPKNHGTCNACSNCGLVLAHGYPPQGYKCGEYCSQCGAKMKNPHYESVTYDYDV